MIASVGAHKMISYVGAKLLPPWAQTFFASVGVNILPPWAQTFCLCRRTKQLAYVGTNFFIFPL
jgi:hypothetical protein